MNEQNNSFELETGDPENGVRLDKCLADKILDCSRSQVKKLIQDGKVRIDSKIVQSPRTLLRPGLTVTMEFSEPEEMVLEPEPFDFPVLFEDDDIVVINKPIETVVHPAIGHDKGTIVNALIGKYADFADRFEYPPEDEQAKLRPGIVHRLDKDTSGCLVVAKNNKALDKLRIAFAERQVTKTYAALSYGAPKVESDEIITQFGRHPIGRKKMAVRKEGGKEAITRYQLLKKGRIDGFPVGLLEIDLLTGRTHQIRVHLAHRSIPVLGDGVYGGRQRLKISRQMLHAWKLTFPHPSNGSKISVQAPWPSDFQELVDSLDEE